VTLEADPALSPTQWFFGEDQARYLVACKPADADAVLAAAASSGVPARKIGATGGTTVSLGASTVPLATLREAHTTGFSRMMGE